MGKAKIKEYQLIVSNSFPFILYRGDLSYFDGLSEPIIAVELVQPKPGIFQPHIQYLLCLATTVEVVLLGVSFSGSNTNYEEMHLLPEPLFAVPTDGAYIVTIRGTTDGRIFMGAKDGCIYEFFYQVNDSQIHQVVQNVKNYFQLGRGRIFQPQVPQNQSLEEHLVLSDSVIHQCGL